MVSPKAQYSEWKMDHSRVTLRAPMMGYSMAIQKDCLTGHDWALPMGPGMADQWELQRAHPKARQRVHQRVHQRAPPKAHVKVQLKALLMAGQRAMLKVDKMAG